MYCMYEYCTGDVLLRVCMCMCVYVCVCVCVCMCMCMCECLCVPGKKEVRLLYIYDNLSPYTMKQDEKTNKKFPFEIRFSIFSS